MRAKTDARQQALSEVRDALRALAANIIGIVRGAGKPLELSSQVEAFSAALGAFESAAEGRHPKAWEFAEMLRVELEPKLVTQRLKTNWLNTMRNTPSSRRRCSSLRRGCWSRSLARQRRWRRSIAR